MRRIKSAVARFVRRLLPLGSRQRRVIAGLVQGVRAGRSRYSEVTALAVHRLAGKPGKLTRYSAWRRQERRRLRRRGTGSARTTTFTIVIETGERSDASRSTRASILAQPGPATQVIETPTGSDLATVLADATGDFVLFLRAGSRLAVGALAAIARAHQTDPTLDLVGFDSDVIKVGRGVGSPFFRPAWSPEMLLSTNYFGRAFALRTGVAARYATSALSDTGVWELLLRAGLAGCQVGSLSRVLLSEPSRAVEPATVEQAAMLERVLAEHGEQAVVRVSDGRVRVDFVPGEWPTVSIVVPTRHSRGNLTRLFASLSATDYEHFDVTVIDNGAQTPENVAWYGGLAWAFEPSVIWWTEQPFNYSRVNNVAVRTTSGEVVVMLNDDTEIVDASWLKSMVGMLMRDGVGTVGFQHLQGDGLIQHGGVMIGPGGFADNLFSGMKPHSNTLIGSTDWYRNSLAVTGACVAIRRADFDEIGGLDERFILCGSDVVLGLDQVLRERRSVVIPFDMVRHYESLTRGTAVPREDFFASYWRYHPWLQAGDPYVSPNISRLSARPVFAATTDPDPVALSLVALGRHLAKAQQQSTISDEAMGLLAQASVPRSVVEQVRKSHEATSGFRDVQTINWYIPDIDMPFFGGLNTAFRLASYLTETQGIKNRFVILAAPNEEFFRSAIAAAFENLADSEFHFYDGQDETLATIPKADASVATLWLTAMHVAKATDAPRKFYLMQDYEPAFYPASTMFAMAEESYRLGLYAICNTESMHRIYSGLYGGKSIYFAPAVDRAWFNPQGRREKSDTDPVTIFAYARDHFRNCWELAGAALSEIKRIHGDRVRIVVAGARYLPASSDFVDLGLLDHRATGALYRETDIGLTLQISRHPSYLPLELMACGVPMVAPDSDWFKWLFRDGENSLLAMRSLDDVVAQLDRLVRDAELRRSLSVEALKTIDTAHSSWETAFAPIHRFLSDPEMVIREQATHEGALAD